MLEYETSEAVLTTWALCGYRFFVLMAAAGPHRPASLANWHRFAVSAGEKNRTSATFAATICHPNIGGAAKMTSGPVPREPMGRALHRFPDRE